MALVEPRRNDTILEADGIKIAVGAQEKKIIDQFGGFLEVNFNSDGYWPGFRIISPIGGSSCA